AFALLAGISLQTHLSGALPVAICVAVLIAYRPDAVDLRAVGVAAIALLACYVPFLVAEVQAGFLNVRHMHEGLLPWVGPRAVVRSLGSEFLYPSLNLTDASARLASSWELVVRDASLGLTVALVLLGAFTSYRLKIISLFILIGLPAYFALNHRA